MYLSPILCSCASVVDHAHVEEPHALLPHALRLLHQGADVRSLVHHLRVRQIDEHRQVRARDDAVLLVVDDDAAGSIVRRAAEDVDEEEDAARRVELVQSRLVLRRDVRRPLSRQERDRRRVLHLAENHIDRRQKLLG